MRRAFDAFLNCFKITRFCLGILFIPLKSIIVGHTNSPFPFFYFNYFFLPWVSFNKYIHTFIHTPSPGPPFFPFFLFLKWNRLDNWFRKISYHCILQHAFFWWWWCRFESCSGIHDKSYSVSHRNFPEGGITTIMALFLEHFCIKNAKFSWRSMQKKCQMLSKSKNS